MYGIDITTELRAIKSALGHRDSPMITGSQLSSLIHSVAPNLDIRTVVGIPKGRGALTEFICRYLSDDIEGIGKQGADVLHRIKGREAAALPTSAFPQIWRTFVSPNTSQHLVLSRRARLLLARNTPALTAGDEVEIAKASLAEHDQMRADFVASLPEPHAAALRAHAASDADFASWIGALREHLPEAMRHWGNFRRRRLSELFAARISELEIDEPLRRAVIEQIKTSERLAYVTVKGDKAAFVKQMAQPANPGDTTDAISRARRLAHAAIDQMAYDELRALRMPLGAILDGIGAEA